MTLMVCAGAGVFGVQALRGLFLSPAKLTAARRAPINATVEVQCSAVC